MSLEELREQNIRLVTEKALECFIKNGINNTRVSEIAAESGLTQRSVFRYFPSKDDIVIAAAFCYWERTKAYIARELRRHTDDAQTGIEQINIILNSYANMLFVDPEGIRFSLDAEVALYSVGKRTRTLSTDRRSATRRTKAPCHRRCAADLRTGRSILARTSSSCITTPTIPSSA